MNEWKKCNLGEIAERITSGGTPSTRKSEYYGGDIPWLRTQEVNFNRIYNTEICITEEAVENSSAKFIKENSIIVAMYGATAGRIAINKIPLTTNQACCNITIDAKKADYNYIYYFLKSKFEGILRMATGAAQQNLNAGMLRDFEILAPSLPTQRHIAQILTSFDDKIALLGQMNQTLETMAQAIFKEWFVNFNFPGFDGTLVEGLPKGWRREAIDKDIEFLNGLALQKFPPINEDDYLPVIKIREMRQGVSSSSDKATTEIPEKYIIEDGEILFSWSGSLEVIIWCNGKGALNQHLFKVSSNKYPKWFYYCWTKHFLPIYQSIALDKATTMGHIQRKHLTESLINVPDFEVLTKGNDILGPIIEKIINNSVQIRTLTSLRDALLPKLMGGAVFV